MRELPLELEALSSIEKINLICLLLRSLPSQDLPVSEVLLVDLELRVTSGDLNPSGKSPWYIVGTELKEALRIRSFANGTLCKA